MAVSDRKMGIVPAADADVKKLAFMMGGVNP